MPSRSEIRFSAEAESDLRALLASSLLTWGAEQCDAYADAIDSALDRLTLFPDLGRVRDDLFVGCRALRVRQHVIYYAAGEGIINVARILHVRMNTGGVFGGPGSGSGM